MFSFEYTVSVRFCFRFGVFIRSERITVSGEANFNSGIHKRNVYINITYNNRSNGLKRTDLSELYVCVCECVFLLLILFDFSEKAFGTILFFEMPFTLTAFRLWRCNSAMFVCVYAIHQLCCY